MELQILTELSTNSKSMKKSINNFGRMLGVFMLYAGLFLSSCTEKEPEEVLVSSVSLNKSSVEMSVGEIVELTATVLPENAETLDVTWASSDPGIATVEDGLVTAIKAGEAEITVKTVEGGKTDVCKVIVKADPVVFALDKVTAATATFSGHLNVPAADLPYCQVSVYYSDAENFNMNDAKSASVTVFDDNQDFAITLKNLKYGVKYHYCMVADIKQSDKVYGEIKEFTTKAVTLSLAYTGSTATTATISGKVTGLSPEDQEYIKVGLYYSDNLENLTEYFRNKVLAEDIQDDGSFSLILSDLTLGNKYYYCTYIYCSAYSKDSEAAAFGDAHEFIVGEHVSMTAKVDEASITATTAQIIGKIEGISTDEMEGFVYGICYSCEPITDSNRGSTITIEELSEDGSFSLTLSRLGYGTKYYFCSYLRQGHSSRTYGEVQEFTTDEVTVTLSISKFIDTAVFTFKAIGLSEVDKSDSPINFCCSPYEDRLLNVSYNNGEKPNEQLRYYSNDWDENYEITFSNSLFTYGKKYYYQYRVYNNNFNNYDSEIESFVMGEDINVSLSIEALTHNSASLKGQITGWSSDYPVEIGVYYSEVPLTTDYARREAKNVEISNVSSNGEFNVELTELAYSTKYYYYLYIKSRLSVPCEGVFVTRSPSSSETADLDMAGAADLSSDGSANCYIISEKGLYKFKTVKGNSNEYLKNVSSCQILWESYGTNANIQPYDLIKGICYRDEYIAFQTSDSFKEGNAVIAATDANGNILWSWHIWMTDQPQGQIYYNDAGTMMDRNLGATTTVPGSVGALGLLYQWGRKDPFLSSSSISSSTHTKSSITWPSAVESKYSTGRIEYATAHPTIFITRRGAICDWQWEDADRTSWTTSETSKSIYDPCPAGWRVPDGGNDGVWAKALGSSSYFIESSLYDSTNEGINFSSKFGNDQNIWYPASGYCNEYNLVDSVGYAGHYWSASPNSTYSYYLNFSDNGLVYPSFNSYNWASGKSVRCIKE